MELLDQNGDGFACGETDIRRGSARRNRDSERFLIRAKIGPIEREVFLDTGAPFSGIVTMAADEFVPEDAEPDREDRITIRGDVYPGYLYSIPIVLLARSGRDLKIDGTIFLAQGDYHEDFLPFLGLNGCLEQVRFAIDPVEEKFYFGEAG